MHEHATLRGSHDDEVGAHGTSAVAVGGVVEGEHCCATAANCADSGGVDMTSDLGPASDRRTRSPPDGTHVTKPQLSGFGNAHTYHAQATARRHVSCGIRAHAPFRTRSKAIVWRRTHAGRPKLRPGVLPYARLECAWCFLHGGPSPWLESGAVGGTTGATGRRAVAVAAPLHTFVAAATSGEMCDAAPPRPQRLLLRCETLAWWLLVAAA